MFQKIYTSTNSQKEVLNEPKTIIFDISGRKLIPNFPWVSQMVTKCVIFDTL